MIPYSFDKVFVLPYDLIVDANGVDDQVTHIVPLSNA
jgi:hypothetical protein